MGLFGKLFGGPTSPADPVRTKSTVPIIAEGADDGSRAVPARVLTFDEDFASTDAEFAKMVRQSADDILAGYHERYLAIFGAALGEQHEDLDIDFVHDQLEHLAANLADWPHITSERVHATFQASAAAAWGLGKEDEDSLGLFFRAYANASHYDAITLESVVRAATATFDAALDRAAEAFPSFDVDDIGRLCDLWDERHWTMQMEWRRMHRDRFHALFESWGAFQREDVLGAAVIEMFRAHAKPHADNAIRRYRRILVPVVTAHFVERDMAAALNKLGSDTLELLRNVAFAQAPDLASQLGQSPRLESAFLLAWHDAWGKCEDTKARAIEQGQTEYEQEIAMLHASDQFTRYVDAHIDAGWTAVFQEIRDFYAEAALKSSYAANTDIGPSQGV